MRRYLTFLGLMAVMAAPIAAYSDNIPYDPAHISGAERYKVSFRSAGSAPTTDPGLAGIFGGSTAPLLQSPWGFFDASAPTYPFFETEESRAGAKDNRGGPLTDAQYGEQGRIAETVHTLLSRDAFFFSGHKGPFPVDVTTPASVTLPASPVPEPSSLALLGTGLIGLACIVRRRMSAKG